MTGTLSILNVGDGDTKLSFDPKKPSEAKRTAEIVTDMLRRGYVLLVEVGADEKGPIYRRATGFDPDTTEYIIAGTVSDQEDVSDAKPKSAPRRSKAHSIPKNRVKAATTNAVAIARTAGG